MILLYCVDQILFSVIHIHSIVELLVHGDLELRHGRVLPLDFIRAGILPSDLLNVHVGTLRHRSLHFIPDPLIYNRRFQACSGEHLCVTGASAHLLLERELDLVKEAEGGTAFLVHDVVDLLAFEFDLQLAKGILNFIEIVHLGFLVAPSQNVTVRFSLTFLRNWRGQPVHHKMIELLQTGSRLQNQSRSCSQSIHEA